jgi:enoyl-CoA hydratase/carnithine racemase
MASETSSSDGPPASGIAEPQASDVGRITGERRGRVFVITIDRPRKLNGFTPAMLGQLAAAYTEFEADENLWCAILAAEGAHFTAGLQLSEFDITSDLVPEGMIDPLALRPPFRRKPLVAAVKGICFTIGIELMLAADIAVAEQGTRFGQLEVRRGLCAYGGATFRFVERAGWGNAMRYLLTGDEFDASVALRLGFVQEVAPAGKGLDLALEIAGRIARQAPLAVRATRDNAETYLRHGQDAAVRELPALRTRLAGSEDFAEGVRSFRERREGVYRGR